MSTKKNAGVVTAYGAAVQAGYEGSYEDFCAEMADLGIQVGYLENMTVTVNILTPSSSASASYANGVLTLNIPRGNKGEKGDIGSTPNLTIGTVTTGEPGSSAAATITGTAENPVLNLTIPEGEKGDKGNPGEVPAAAIAGTQASTTASKALAVGEHFWLNGTLYTATSPIASGGTIVTTGSGKNCDLAVIGNELASQSEKIEEVKDSFDEVLSKNIYHCTSYDIGYRASTDVANGNTDYVAVNDYFPVEAGETYVFSRFGKQSGTYATFNPILTYYNANKVHQGYAQVSNSVYTIPSGMSYIRVSVGVQTFADYNIQIEKGTEHTSYEAYYDLLVLKDSSNGLTQRVEGLESKYVKEVSKNLYHATSFEIGYRASSDTPTANTGYIAVNDYFPVEGGASYCFRFFNGRVWLQNWSPIICYYDASKTHLGYYQVSNGVQELPATAKFIRVSMPKSHFYGNNLLQIEKGTEHTTYEPFYDFTALDSDYLDTVFLDGRYSPKPTTHVIWVGSSASCDYAKVQDAIASINPTNAGEEYNQYVIYIEEGEYDLGSDFTEDEIADSSFWGIKVPDYCTLIGVGDRSKVILSCELEEPNSHISALNFSNTSGVENLTIISEGCRYTIHDDNAVLNGAKGFKRRMKNCVVKGVGNYYDSVYGSGLREGADWEFENCVFDATEVNRSGDGNGIAWFTHNNVNFEYPCNIKFKNCRFLSSLDNGAVVLRTMTTNANDMITYVQFYGCKIGTGTHGLYLREEAAQTYGAGCLYRVSGFGNVNETYSIQVSDGKDYSANVDFLS